MCLLCLLMVCLIAKLIVPFNVAASAAATLCFVSIILVGQLYCEFLLIHHNSHGLMSLADFPNECAALFNQSCTKLMADKRVCRIKQRWIGKNSPYMYYMYVCTLKMKVLQGHYVSVHILGTIPCGIFRTCEKEATGVMGFVVFRFTFK